MMKYTEMLFLQHGLKLPKDPSDEWLKKRILQRTYRCNLCGKDVDIHDIIYRTEDCNMHFICYRCAFRWDNADEFDDIYPPYGK